MTTLPRSVALAVALALLPPLALMAAAGAAAQEPPETPSGESDIFFDRVDVDVVNVEVFVTDRQGAPVSGLTAADFEVFEDGRPVEITNFYAVDGGRPSIAAAGGEAADGAGAGGGGEAAGTDGVEAVPAAPEDQRLHLVVYVDNLNIRPENRAWVMAALRRFVHQHTRRDDRVMLVTYDRSLHVRQPFTSDPQLVLGALDQVGRLTAGAAARDIDRRSAMLIIESARRYDEALQAARSHAQHVHHETETTLQAVKELIDVLGGVVGRKALLYVSDGLPMVPGEDLYVAVEEKFGGVSSRLRARHYDLAPRYRHLAAQANAAGVTLYMLEARGLEVAAGVSAEEMGSPLNRFAIEATRDANLEQPLIDLAKATGGQAILNTNAVDSALDRVAGDFRSYYSIGYRAAHSRDGRYHRIEVRTKRPGLTMRHREGYRDKSTESAMIESALAALHFGFASNPLGARLELAEPARDGDRLFSIPVTVRVPLSEVTLVPQGDVYRGRLRLWVGVADAEGGVSPITEQEPLELTVPAAEIEQAMGSFYSYQLQLRIAAGRQRVALAIHDELGGRSSVVAAPVTVGG